MQNENICLFGSDLVRNESGILRNLLKSNFPCVGHPAGLFFVNTWISITLDIVISSKSECLSKSMFVYIIWRDIF